MGDINERYPQVFVHAFKFELHFLAHFKVERTQRFVEKQHFRLAHYCAGNCDTLLLTAGQLLREMLRTVTDRHPVHRFFDTAFPFVGRNSHIQKRQFDVLIDIQFFYQVEALEHKADDTFPQVRSLRFGIFRDFYAVQIIRSVGRIIQQAQNIQQSGLTTSRRSHNSDKFALLYFYTYVIQRPGFHLVCTENLL